MQKTLLFKGVSAFALSSFLLTTAHVANAQGAVNVLKDEIIVTATKKAGGENVQDVPLSITAYGADQLDALQVRDISGLSFKMPNVSLDDIGTAKGTANFAIRGLGVNSSIPSIDPAVGLFIDGMYLGINTGVIFDTFDLESIEVLRGPQGVLFGRNVTGGAVLINTADPSYDKSIKAKFAVESGLRGSGVNSYAMASVTGPIIEDKVAAKLAVYYNKDEGWFKNILPTGGTEDFGESETYIIRPALKFNPSPNSELILKFETGKITGDGPAGQSHTNGSGVDGQIVNFSRESFDLSIDEGGSIRNKWSHAIAEFNLDVAFGDGTITNIVAWREFTQEGTSDIDSTPAFLFHADFLTDQDQFSNELRYSGRFNDNLDVTTGVYYFTQDLAAAEIRNILGGALTQHGGGVQDHRTYGAFARFNYDVNDQFSVNAGIRYTDEKKEVEVASLFRNVNSPCNVIVGTCVPDFIDDIKFTNWAPTVGFGYEINDVSRMYGHWKRAYRAGGYNFRNTAPGFLPGPFGDERVDSFELGYKTELNGRGRLNAAVFYTTIADMQREVNLSDNTAAVVQLIRNTADADLYGFELDGQYAVTDNLLFTGSVGYVKGDLKNVLFDLNSDGALNAADANLDIPRLSPFTANVGFIYDHEMGNVGVLTARANYSHRDQAAYTDNNLGILNASDRIDASLTLSMNDGRTNVSLYGKNITNDVQHGNDTQLPALLGPVPLGGTFAPLAKGGVYGIELQLKFD
jgi:iron complex outermembrane receptor protein